MTAKQILKSIKLNPYREILSITTEEAIGNLLEFIKEWELSVKVKDIKKEDWKKLLYDYASAIINYHPDNDHQERAVFLTNEKMLKKYGLTSEDIQRLDFC